MPRDKRVLGFRSSWLRRSFRLDRNHFDSKIGDSDGFCEFTCVLDFEFVFDDECFDVCYDDV